MAEAIQFPCPSCGAILTLPPEMAAVQGPCPLCRQEIIAPDPAQGLEARIVTPEPPPPPPVDTPEVSPTTEVPPESAPAPPRSTRWFPIFLTAAVCLLAGYFIGVRSRMNLPTATAPVETLIAPPANPAPPPPATTPEPPETTPEPPAPEPEPAPEPIKASAAAEAALKAFLDAPDWAARAAHVISPEAVRSAMEAHSHNVPDGPTPYESITVQNSYTDKVTGNTLFIFKLVTSTHPTGIPVAVVETDSGWQVDWQTFIEFHDDLFQSFAEGPVDETGRFHLLVSAPPADRAANTENEHFASFLLEPPLPDRQRLAYMRKPSEIHNTLNAATADGAFFTPVLEITKRKIPDGKSYLEITGIVSDDWLPEAR